MTRQHSRNGAIFLIVLGLLILLSQAGVNVWHVFGLVNWNLFGPLLLIALGVAALVRRQSQA
jgi:hypothetical protein